MAEARDGGALEVGQGLRSHWELPSWEPLEPSRRLLGTLGTSLEASGTRLFPRCRFEPIKAPPWKHLKRAPLDVGGDK